MKRNLTALLTLLTFPGLSLTSPALAQDADSTDLRLLYRLACGHIFEKNINNWSDTQAYPDQTLQLTNSCYLIKHGEDWLL